MPCLEVQNILLNVTFLNFLLKHAQYETVQFRIWKKIPVFRYLARSSVLNSQSRWIIFTKEGLEQFSSQTSLSLDGPRKPCVCLLWENLQFENVDKIKSRKEKKLLHLGYH